MTRTRPVFDEAPSRMSVPEEVLEFAHCFADTETKIWTVERGRCTPRKIQLIFQCRLHRVRRIIHDQLPEPPELCAGGEEANEEHGRLRVKLYQEAKRHGTRADPLWRTGPNRMCATLFRGVPKRTLYARKVPCASLVVVQSARSRSSKSARYDRQPAADARPLLDREGSGDARENESAVPLA